MNPAIVEKIGRRRRQILVHSAIYYYFNDNLITDSTYDSWSRELVSLTVNHPHEANMAPYAEEFKDWHGDTGYSLPWDREEILSRANSLLISRSMR